jgi:dihydrofolate reductase
MKKGKARRRLRYQVAVSLDGFIAGPNGEYDWIVMDSAIDFKALYAEFDTAVMGRKTYDMMTAQGGHGEMPGLDVVVFSQTLPPSAYPGVRITNHDPREIVAELKAKSGKDIWLFGGGVLFRTLLEAGLVDSVEVAVMPVLLGAGIPLLPPSASTKLVLVDQKTLPRSGIVVLSYSVPGGVAPAPPIRFVKPTSRASKKTTPKKRTKTTAKKAASRRRRA